MLSAGEILMGSGKQQVIHIITRLVHGGADLNTVYSVKGLAEKGWDVSLWVGREFVAFRDELQSSNVKVTVIPELVRDINPKADIRALTYMVKALKRQRPTIVHTHTAKAGVLGRWAARLARVPIIIHTLHGGPLDSISHPTVRMVLAATERRVAKWTDYFVSVGQDILFRLAKEGFAELDRSTVIRSGIDLAQWESSPCEVQRFRSEVMKPTKKHVIGKIGRLAPQKGYEDFLRVVRHVTRMRDDVEFLVLGRKDQSEYASRILRDSEDLQSQGVLRFLGELPASQVPLFINNCSIMVHTAHWEGVPRVVVESLICNRPVVAFQTDGVNEVISNGINGFVIADRNIEAMAQRIVEVLDNGGYVSPVQGRKNEEIRREFAKETMIDRLDELYREMVQKQKRFLDRRTLLSGA